MPIILFSHCLHVIWFELLLIFNDTKSFKEPFKIVIISIFYSAFKLFSLISVIFNVFIFIDYFYSAWWLSVAYRKVHLAVRDLSFYFTYEWKNLDYICLTFFKVINLIQLKCFNCKFYSKLKKNKNSLLKTVEVYDEV